MGQKQSTIDALIAGQTPTSNAIAAATAKYAAQQEEKQADQIIQHLQTIDRVMDEQVSNLRILRAREKAQAKKVLALNAAKEQYLKDADWDKFMKVYREL
jgi:hypothetical protein